MRPRIRLLVIFTPVMTHCRGDDHFLPFYLDGRRPVYLAMLVLCSVASIGVARSNNAVQLMASRFMQAFGASPGIPIGTAVIGDLYQLEQCGTALGVFFAVCLVIWFSR